MKKETLESIRGHVNAIHRILESDPEDEPQTILATTSELRGVVEASLKEILFQEYRQNQKPQQRPEY